MAIVKVAIAIEWDGRIVVQSFARTSLGFGLAAKCFGPIDAEGSDLDLGVLAGAALDHEEADPDSLPQVGLPPYVGLLGCTTEGQIFGSGRAVAIGRRDGRTTVRAQATDGGGWSGTTSMPRVVLDVNDETPAALGAAIREMLAAFTYLGPEEPSHT